MTGATMTAALTPAPVRHRSRAFWAWTLWRGAIMALYAASWLLMLVSGQEQKTFADLENALATGRVQSVRVDGSLDDRPGDPPGSAVARLVWHEGSHDRVTTVRQVIGETTPVSNEPELTLVRGSLTERLRRSNPDVSISPLESRSGVSSSLGHWEVHGTAWAWLPLLTWTLLFLGIVGGPEPRHATRWAWFWMMTSPLAVLVPPVFALTQTRGHHPGERRLSGWWAWGLAAFLLPALLPVVL